MVFAKAKCVPWELPVSSYWAKCTGDEEGRKGDASNASSGCTLEGGGANLFHFVINTGSLSSVINGISNSVLRLFLSFINKNCNSVKIALKTICSNACAVMGEIDHGLIWG